MTKQAKGHNAPTDNRKCEVRELHPNTDCLYCAELKQKICPAFEKRCTVCGEENHFTSVCVFWRNAIIRQLVRREYEEHSKSFTQLVKAC